MPKRMLFPLPITTKKRPRLAIKWPGTFLCCVRFLWDEATSTFLIYSRSDAKRLEHIKRNSRVALNFDGNGSGGDIIVFTGVAEVSTADPPADQLPAYVEKYRDIIARRYNTPERFASIYSVALRMKPRRIRGH